MKRGDVKTFEHLYKSFYSDLFHYAVKLTTQPELAEDAIHDTFTYIWQNRKQLGKVTSVKFYLLRSVRNRCLKLLQKGQRLETLEKVEQNIELVIQPEELELGGESQATRAHIQTALHGLSGRQREIIFLKYFNNLDYQEIAELLSINYQSVVNHIHRAVVKLRKAEDLQHFK